MATTFSPRAAPPGRGRSSWPGLWRGVGTLAAALLMLSSLLLTWVTLGYAGIRDVRFSNLDQQLVGIISDRTAETEPLFPVASVGKGIIGPPSVYAGAQRVTRAPFPGPWLIVLLSAAVALAGVALLIGVAWSASRTVGRAFVVVASFAALVGVGEAMMSLAIARYSLTVGQASGYLQPGSASYALGLGSLVALGLLCPVIVAPRDRPSGAPSPASLASAFAHAPAGLAAWVVVGLTGAVLAYPAALVIGSLDENLSNFWYHTPLIVVAAAVVPVLLLGGWASTHERPLKWLAWTIAGAAVGAVALMAITIISSEVAYQY